MEGVIFMTINEETRLAILFYSSQGLPVKIIANQLQVDEKTVFNIIFRNEIKRIFKQES